MSVFTSYAHYYDLLYREKDYSGEVKFVHQLLQTHAPNTQSILELGCGTGIHAVLLAEHGYRICGVDISTEMLQKASHRLLQPTSQLATQLEFRQGDVRDVRLDRQFDAVISLFHVVSYQSTNDDLRSMFSTVKSHLKAGGVFIFDCWYGPAVLSDRPTVRIKRLEDDVFQITRIAEPLMYPNENLVDVHYQILIQNKFSDTVEEIQEVHRMRYLFQPEIELLFDQIGLKLISSREWMTDESAGFNTWGVYFVAQARE